MSRNITTYIGIAFYSANGFPAQPTVVLSEYIGFDIIKSRGTIVETVNGWAEAWDESNTSPTIFQFEPYLTLVGIALVAKVHLPARAISSAISSLRWNAAHGARGDGNSPKHILSSDYVLRALNHLCNTGTISLQYEVSSQLDKKMTDALEKLQATQTARPHLYGVIPLGGDNVIGFGQMKMKF